MFSRIILVTGLFALICAGTMSAQTLSIVQGNGQLDCDGCATGSYSFFDDLVVLVTDASGKPIANATVNWSVTDADGLQPPQGILISGASTVTGSTAPGPGVNICNQTGYSCNRYNGSDTGGLSLRVMAVTASITGQSVTFTLTESPNASSSGVTESNAQVQITGPQPNSTTTYQGTANSTSPTPITVTAVTNGGLPIPNVSVRLVPDPGNPAGSPTASCATQAGADPGSVLTNSAGLATCNVVFGATPSSGNPPQSVYFWVLIGGVTTPLFNGQNPALLGLGGPVGFAAPFNGRYALIVTPATPNAVNLVSGNFQSANPGQTLPAPLVVQVVDQNSNPLPGTAVTWTATPAAGAVITPSGATDANGKASATIMLSNSAAGVVSIMAATANGKTFTFSETAVIVVTVTGVSVAGGNNQSVPVGGTFQAITAQVAASGGSVANVPVTFTVVSGPATLTGTNPATTSANGLAAVGVQAGATPGPVVITATAAGQTATFNLTVTPPALTLSNANFLNGAGFFATDTAGTFSALSPCSVGTLVIGVPLTTATLPATPNLFPAAIQQPTGVSIAFNPQTTNEAAPILSVTGLNSAQTIITFQVPCDLTNLGGNIPVSVTINGASTLQPVNVVVREASLGIFEIPMSDGKRRALLVHQDGTIVSLEQPARPGEMVRMYVTGIGPTSPPLVTGGLPQPGVDTLSKSVFRAVEIGSQGGIAVVSERASPDLVGVYEITFQVPANATTNNDTNLEVGVIVNTGESYNLGQPSGSKIPIHQ